MTDSLFVVMCNTGPFHCVVDTIVTSGWPGGPGDLFVLGVPSSRYTTWTLRPPATMSRVRVSLVWVMTHDSPKIAAVLLPFTSRARRALLAASAVQRPLKSGTVVPCDEIASATTRDEMIAHMSETPFFRWTPFLDEWPVGEMEVRDGA